MDLMIWLSLVSLENHRGPVRDLASWEGGRCVAGASGSLSLKIRPPPPKLMLVSHNRPALRTHHTMLVLLLNRCSRFDFIIIGE